MEEKREEKTKLKIKKERKFHNLLSFYANGLQTMYSETDIVLIFVQEPQLDDGYNNAIRIYISPSFAEKLAKSVVHTLESQKKTNAKKGKRKSLEKKS